MSSTQLAAIDAWIRAENERMSRPEAIRRLVEFGLSVKSTNGGLMRYDQGPARRRWPEAQSIS